jgi:hypothetical protein
VQRQFVSDSRRRRRDRGCRQRRLPGLPRQRARVRQRREARRGAALLDVRERRGKNELRLVVTNAGDGNGSDHADWAAARITGCTAAPPPVSITNLSPKDTANAADWSVQANLQVGNNVYGDRDVHLHGDAGHRGGRGVDPAGERLEDLRGQSRRHVLDQHGGGRLRRAERRRRAEPAWVDATWVDTG